MKGPEYVLKSGLSRQQFPLGEWRETKLKEIDDRAWQWFPYYAKLPHDDPIAMLKWRIYCRRRCAHDVKFREAIWELGRRDVAFWIETFVWIFEPRPNPRRLPFHLYHDQVSVLAWILETYGVRDAGVTKTRGIGLSWLVAAIIKHKWYYEPGAKIAVLTRDEDILDTNDSNSTIGKLQYIYDNMPTWAKFTRTGKPLLKRAITTHFYQNMENDTLVQGFVSTSTKLNQLRFTWLFADEFAYYDRTDQTQWMTSSAGTVNSRLFVSTWNDFDDMFHHIIHEEESSLLKISAFWWNCYERWKGAYYMEHGVPILVDKEYRHPPDYPFGEPGIVDDGMLRSPWVDYELSRPGVDRIKTLRDLYGMSVCLAGDTPVLTDRGVVPIVEVRRDDRVWDGEEWVPHEGVSFNGVRHTIEKFGVHLTPNHKVLSDAGWVKASEISRQFSRAEVRHPNSIAPRRQRQVGGETVDVPLRLRTGDSAINRRAANARQERRPTGLQQAVSAAPESTTRLLRRAYVEKLAEYARSVLQPISGELRAVWWLWDSGVRTVAGVREFLSRYGRTAAGRNAGSDRRGGALRARQLSLGNATRTGVEPPNDGNDPNAVGSRARGRGVTTNWHPRADDTCPDAAGVVGGSLVAARATTEAVYDIVNCGPRRRFAVLDHNNELLLVSNCERTNSFFSGEVRKAIAATVQPPSRQGRLHNNGGKLELEPTTKSDLRLWQNVPDTDRGPYTMYCDLGGGANLAYSVAAAFDKTGEQVVEYGVNDVDITTFATNVCALARWLAGDEGDGWVLIDLDNIGPLSKPFCTELERLSYGNIWSSKIVDQKTRNRKIRAGEVPEYYGTTNRDGGLANFRELSRAVMAMDAIIRSQNVADDINRCSRDSDTGKPKFAKPTAQKGHGDYAQAAAGAWWRMRQLVDLEARGGEAGETVVKSKETAPWDSENRGLWSDQYD